MTTPDEDSVPDQVNNNEIKEEINIQYHWYMFSFLIIYLGSFIIPGIIIGLYVQYVFIPYFLETTTLSSLFTELLPLLALTLFPLVAMGCYILHVFFVGIIGRWFWSITEKKSPTKDGIIPRNIPSKTLNYYHIRGFMIKYPKNIVMKGPFPWLANWIFNTIGSNKIGKGTTIEEQVCADKYCDVSDNCFVGVNSVLTSHMVEGIFGNVPYFEIKLGDNVTCSGLNCIAPGTQIDDNSSLLPFACTSKYNHMKGNNYYFGIPLRKIFKKKIEEYLKLSKEDLARDKLLKEQQRSKKEVKKPVEEEGV